MIVMGRSVLSKFWGNWQFVKQSIFPKLMETLVKNQRKDGSWDREAVSDGRYGNVYTTALSVLALTQPYQLGPIFQR